MRKLKTCGLAVVAMTFSACGPAPEGSEQTPSDTEVSLNATTWTPAQPSSCSTLSNNVPCAFISAVSPGTSL